MEKAVHRQKLQRFGTAKAQRTQRKDKKRKLLDKINRIYRMKKVARTETQPIETSLRNF